MELTGTPNGRSGWYNINNATPSRCQFIPSFFPLGEHAESASLGRLHQTSRELLAIFSIWLLHREAWEGNSLYPANRQMQWNTFRKMTNHAQIQMELLTAAPPFLLFSCLLSLLYQNPRRILGPALSDFSRELHCKQCIFLISISQMY